MNNQTFGPTAKPLSERIAAIKPGNPAPNAMARAIGIAIANALVNERTIQRSAETDGAGEAQIATRRNAVGPTEALNVRCPVRVKDAFRAFCDAERLGYWQGIERLLQITGKLP